MSSCISSQPSGDRAAPQDELGGGGGSSEGQKPCEALRGLSSLSIRLGMESFIVVTECEPGCAADHGLARDRLLEADGPGIPLDAGSQTRPRFSSCKLSLQDRPQPDANGRCAHPAQPPSPVGSPQSSPRLPRRPTVESHHVSITGMQARERPCAGLRVRSAPPAHSRRDQLVGEVTPETQAGREAGGKDVSKGCSRGAGYRWAAGALCVWGSRVTGRI